ncbi:hypothetical protein [Rothia nasimurium]|uniref:hypothetical protein n=1 Tax=Rothia nasimurium TaxID=85336 RepID=UPI001F48F0D1|nr:hypothetical protein [Rothia nasimurium]
MKFIFLPSAAKHGYTEADALNAIKNYHRHKPRFEQSRIPNLPDPDLYIGPSRKGDLLEVMVYEVTPDIVIFHCMKLRGKTYTKTLQ